MSEVVYIASYGCTTSAGAGVPRLWEALLSSSNLPHSPRNYNKWPVKPDLTPKVFQWQSEIERVAGNYKTLLVEQLLSAWKECANSTKKKFKRLGILFASTKGSVEDWIWGELSSIPATDCLQPVLSDLIQKLNLKPIRTACISSACSSSQGAIELARNWIVQGHCDDVLVFAADAIGPFICNGFNALKALSPTRVQPFTQDRDGLQLGESAAVIWFSGTNGNLCLTATSTISEGFASTRPSLDGSGLRQAISEVTKKIDGQIDAIIAHGTGTGPNDATEDRVFANHFCTTPPITATKWAIGHCMAASGAIDLIVACETIKRGVLPPIRSGVSPDPSLLVKKYLFQMPLTSSFTNILVTSLGFGGVNGASIVSKVGKAKVNVKTQRQNRNKKANIQSARFNNKELCSMSQTPDWAESIERWYQLDQPGRALPHAFAELKSRLKSPGSIFLASPAASNTTDRHFVQSNATSPSKFVHTLPNIRITGLLQLMKWQGPVFTVQAGDATLEVAVREAFEWVCKSQRPAWVIYYEEGINGAKVSFWELYEQTLLGHGEAECHLN